MTAPLASISARAAEGPLDVRDIAVDAYTYAYPMLVMDTTRRFATSLPEPDCEHGAGAPMNQFSHLSHWPGAASCEVVRPNLDTLYSSLWFDVTADPLIVSVPDAGDRFYSLMLIDYWTDVFASVGSRTTGNAAHRFAIAGPSWHGSLPDGIGVYRSPTGLGSIIGLTQLNGAHDVASVAHFQASLSATPWSIGGSVHRLPPKLPDAPLPAGSPAEIVAAMSPLEYFGRLCELTRDNPPHAHDRSIVDRMKRIGLTLGSPLDPASISRAVLAAMDRARDVAIVGFNAAYGRSFTTVNGWRSPGRPRGAFGTDYATRAAAAFAGLGVSASEDALSYVAGKDSSGALLDSSQSYTLTFSRHQQPPTQGFWAITLYDDRQSFADNKARRFALGNCYDLVPGSDGSTTLFIQRESPGSERERNWLPTPRSGTFSLVLRLYWPGSMAVNGSWSPPPVRRTGGAQGLAQPWHGHGRLYR
jgi:hypothetical protein